MPILDETLKDFDNIEIINQDVLKTDLAALIKEKFADMPVYVCANLPYYITTPIIMQLLETGVPLESMTVMVQKEVAERLVAKHNMEEYGAITAVINAVADTKITRIVKRNMFIPAPNVDSAVVRIDFNKQKYNINVTH